MSAVEYVTPWINTRQMLAKTIAAYRRHMEREERGIGDFLNSVFIDEMRLDLSFEDAVDRVIDNGEDLPVGHRLLNYLEFGSDCR